MFSRPLLKLSWHITLWFSLFASVRSRIGMVPRGFVVIVRTEKGDRINEMRSPEYSAGHIVNSGAPGCCSSRRRRSRL